MGLSKELSAKYAGLEPTTASAARSTWGMFLMLISAVFYVLMNVGNKLMYKTTNITPFESVGLRGAAMVLFNLMYAAVYRVDVLQVPKSVSLLMWARTIVGTAGICFCLAANQVLPISIAGSLYYIYPLLTSCGGYLLLHERISRLEVVGMFVSFSGVLFIIFNRQSSELNATDFYNYSLPILGALSDVGVYLITRQVKTSVHFITMPTWYGVVQSMTMAPFWLGWRSHVNKPVNLGVQGVFYCFLMCLGGWLGQIFMNRALQVEKVGRIAAVNYMQIPLLFFVDIFVFCESINLGEIMGSVLIISCSFFAALMRLLNVYQ